jgi:hypothetical protein
MIIKTKYQLLFALLGLLHVCVAQQNFELSDSINQRYLSIQVDTCTHDGFCGGKGIVRLKNKLGKVVQSFSIENLVFSKNNSLVKETLGPVTFRDFNFDGYNDLAIVNGNNGNYSFISYYVYLFSPEQHRFLMNKELTALSNESMGLFKNDKKRKRIITHAKGSFATSVDHEFVFVTPYHIQNVLERFTNIHENMVEEKTNTVINGKWVTTNRSYMITEYKK